MRNCENCYHFHMCDLQYRLEEHQNCKHYKDKSLIIDLPCKVGTKHNKLSFIAVDDVKSKEKGRLYYVLRCDCGNIVSVRKDLWESGNTKACGCLYQTHGQAKKGSRTRIYNIYHGMKKRCYNKASKSYLWYGARGITVCDEWLNDFTVFYDWAISNGYADNLTIERKDNNKDYSPENCCWVTMEQQHKNTRKTTPVRIVETNEVFLTISECAKAIDGFGGNISNCLNGKAKTYKGYHYENLSREEAEKKLKEYKGE